jgi:hypothetical protein
MNDAGAPERPYRFIGKPVPRKEDERLVTGKGRFTDDFNLDGQAYAAMVRSPYPHARIVAIDAAAAKNMAGVIGVFTGADCAAEGLAPIPHDPVPKTKYDMKLTGPGGGAVFAGPHALLPKRLSCTIRNCRSCCVPRTRWLRARRRCGSKHQATSASIRRSVMPRRPSWPLPAPRMS